MVRQGVKNYLSSLKYLFTPLGTIAFGFVCGLSILVPCAISSLQALAAELKEILSEEAVDFAALEQSVLSAVRSLNWDDPVSALQQMLSGDWLSGTLNGCIGVLVEDRDAYASEIDEAVVLFVGQIGAYVAILVLLTLLGAFGGFLLTKGLVRRDMAKRAWWKALLNFAVDTTLSATLVALCAWLLGQWKASIYLSSFLSVLLFGFISLLEAYVLHGLGKVGFREVVNGKNIALLLLTGVMIYLFAAALIAAVILLSNLTIGVFLGIGVLEVTLIVTGLNAEAYVIAVVKARRRTWLKQPLSISRSV